MPVRWLYHLVLASERPAEGASYAPRSLTTEGFVHCSYRDAVAESARLYFADQQPLILRIDPRRIAARIEEAITPRGPMPHVFGPIPADAICEVLTLADLTTAPDEL